MWGGAVKKIREKKTGCYCYVWGLGLHSAQWLCGTYPQLQSQLQLCIL